MPHEIWFANEYKLAAFASMAEGMQEVRADDGEADEANKLSRLARLVWDQHPGHDIPVDCIAYIPSALADAAEAVLENCLDNSSGRTADEADEDEARDFIFPDECQVRPRLSNEELEAKLASREAELADD